MAENHRYVNPRNLSGWERIKLERIRQMSVEGYSHSHDDEHDEGSLVGAAISYALAAISEPEAGEFWPWRNEWKPSPDPVRNLEKAGALIAAELDRRTRFERAS